MPGRSVNEGTPRLRVGEAALQKGAISLKPPTHLEAMGGVINDVAGQLRRDAKQIIQSGKTLPHRISERARRITGGITVLRISDEEAAKKAEEIKQRKEEQSKQVAKRAEKTKQSKQADTKKVDERAETIRKQHEEKKEKKGK